MWKLDSFDEMTCFNKQKSWIYSISDTISCSASVYLITLDFFVKAESDIEQRFISLNINPVTFGEFPYRLFSVYAFL